MDNVPALAFKMKHNTKAIEAVVALIPKLFVWVILEMNANFKVLNEATMLPISQHRAIFTLKCS